jgi:hypothetical protein
MACAMEFMAKFSCTDNWLSECHERFCTLGWEDWSAIVRGAGFEVDARSGPWRNEWLVTSRLQPAATLLAEDGRPIAWPETHLLLVARRPLTGWARD